MVDNFISPDNHFSPNTGIAVLQLLQLLVNKFGLTKEQNFWPRLVEYITELVQGANKQISPEDNLREERIYHTLAYFTAASLAAVDRFDSTLLGHMIAGIAHDRIGWKVAQSFRILIAPSEIMNEDNFCTIRILRKARLYGFTVPKLMNLWRETEDQGTKENYLIALSGIFAHMEIHDLRDHATEILPILLEGTKVANNDFTNTTCITIIRSLVPLVPELVVSHLDSVITRMTDRTHNTLDSPSDASVKCRAAALEVLTLMVSHIEKRLLLKRKLKVLLELDVALDDCSRTVRQAAEKAKMKWFNLIEGDE
jgi:DNA repair/transcription protein MET18/MMS19